MAGANMSRLKLSTCFVQPLLMGPLQHHTPHGLATIATTLPKTGMFRPTLAISFAPLSWRHLFGIVRGAMMHSGLLSRSKWLCHARGRRLYQYVNLASTSWLYVVRVFHNGLLLLFCTNNPRHVDHISSPRGIIHGLRVI